MITKKKVCTAEYFSARHKQENLYPVIFKPARERGEYEH
jgi:hypothetical protein